MRSEMKLCKLAKLNYSLGAGGHVEDIIGTRTYEHATLEMGHKVTDERVKGWGSIRMNIKLLTTRNAGILCVSLCAFILPRHLFGSFPSILETYA